MSGTYVAKIATKSGYAATLPGRRNFMRLCATQKRYDATIATQNEHAATFCDSSLLPDDGIWAAKKSVSATHFGLNVRRGPRPGLNIRIYN